MNEQKAYPEPIAGVLIVNPEGKIFLIKSPKWGGEYTVCGGHIELGETIEQAAKREAKEEKGLDVFGVKLLEIQECIFDPKFYKQKHFIFLDVVCKTKSTEVILDKREALDYVWVSIDEALELPLNTSTRKMILDYKNQKI
jgi:nucleoside triphosphatase